MSTWEIDWSEDNTYIYGVIRTGFDAVHETQDASQRLLDLFEPLSQPVYYLLDAREMTLSFAQMVNVMSQLSQGSTAVFSHPNMRALLIVTNSSLIQMGAKAFGQAQYGGITAISFDSVAEAQAYIAENL